MLISANKHAYHVKKKEPAQASVDLSAERILRPACTVCYMHISEATIITILTNWSLF